nr:MAG TPA: hypothetical protein [Caudoviricetes sp.]
MPGTNPALCFHKDETILQLLLNNTLKIISMNLLFY